MTGETIEISETVRVRIEYDSDSESPDNWENLGKIAYSSSSRTTLGSEQVSSDRMDEIRDGIADGSLIGLPVYAYVHSGATIATTPFSCRWDSGQSGFAYMTKEQALENWGSGKKVKLSPKAKTNALQYLEGYVKTWDMYIKGDIYGYIVEVLVDDEWEEQDSCWGCYGFDYTKVEGRGAVAAVVERLAKEAALAAVAAAAELAEAQEWAARGGVTA